MRYRLLIGGGVFGVAVLQCFSVCSVLNGQADAPQYGCIIFLKAANIRQRQQNAWKIGFRRLVKERIELFFC